MNKNDYYGNLGVTANATSEEIEGAFQELVASRRASHRGTSDLSAAFAVIGNPTMRKTHDLARFGIVTSERLVHAKATTVDFARNAIPEIDVKELVSQTREVALKLTVLGTGAITRAAELTATVSRAVQVAASRQLEKDS